MRPHPASFQLEPLEHRTFFAAAPAGAAAGTDVAPSGAAVLAAAAAPTPTAVLSLAARQELLDHWTGPNRAELQAKLDAKKLGAFDGALLDYMRKRPGNTFFWNQSDVANIKKFINTNLATATVIANANDVVSHRFPDGTSEVYDVQLPAGDINWSTTRSNPDFVDVLNRHEFWMDLSQAHVLTGSSKYVNELIAQLSSWSRQSGGAFEDPNEWESRGSLWQPLSVAVRAGTWSWAYQQVLSSPGWTAAANTLVLYKLRQHGDFLRRVTPYALDRNRALFEAQGLLQIAHLMPEVDQSRDWKRYGRRLLFGAMDAQLHGDGGHAESSPGYADNVILSLLEMYRLDQRKGEAAAWSPTRLATLENAAKAHVQLLTPDGKLPALSDTYRSTIGPFWSRARVILNNPRDFPAAKARLRDAWLFGPTTAGTLLNAPVNPPVPARGATYSMQESGYYVMRSGNDVNARQVTFDAGPTGGGHGHFDLLSFELFGYGKPLISDPGLSSYEINARRNWALSTPAHNTISIDGASHAALEGVGNTNFWSSGISHVAGGYQVTASHAGYSAMEGSPGVMRSLWYDGNGTMLIADLGYGDAPHTFATSFLLPGTNTSRDLAAGWIRSNNASGNVKVQALLQPGQQAHRQNQLAGGTNVFTSDNPDAGVARPATRFYVDQSGTSATFITLVTTYAGKAAPNVTAKIVGSVADGAFQVQIYRDGKPAELVPFFSRPGKNFRPAAPVAGANDVAWDSAGRLHLVYNDRRERNLKYAVRNPNGKWSMVQTIDAGFEAGGWPSLAVDANNNPSVAYFDGDGGDLNYATLDGSGWRVQKVDTAGSVGLYPSLVLSPGDGGAIIAYYHRTLGDLRMAVQVGGGADWRITTIDSQGDVGRSVSMVHDPNRAAQGSLAVAYDDSDTGAKKYAIQAGSGWRIRTVDTTTPTGGGYTSLAFEPFKRGGRFNPTISYYDSSNSALKFARQDSDGRWRTSTVIATGAQGLYTSLFYDAASRANIAFFKKSNVTAYRATLTPEGWSFSRLGTGGREIQTARRPDGALALTNLDADGLRVDLLSS